MPGYRFLTTWCLGAPIDPVWDAIYDSERWPQWWRGVERVVELAPGDEDGLGQRAAYTWRSRLPYELTFEVELTRQERPHLLEGEASGELAGTGTWRLSEGGGVTTVLYEWDVAHDAALDEPPRAARPPRLRLEPRLGHEARGRGPRAASRRAPLVASGGAA